MSRLAENAGPTVSATAAIMLRSLVNFMGGDSLQQLFKVCHKDAAACHGVTKCTPNLRGEDLVLMVMNKLRQKLESHAFADLGAMMEGYAQAAVEVAKGDFRQELDFSSDQLNALDEILVLLSESPDIDLDFESRLWGSYLGEVLRDAMQGSWEMTQYPGGEHAAPAVGVRGSRLFPLMKVYRRLTLGDEEDLRSFFTMVTERLGNPAKVN